MTGFDAVVLAGGNAERFDGIDKALVTVGGATLLDRVVYAAAGACTVICVGPRRDTEGSVVWAREDPPGGGPVAGLAAGFRHVRESVVVVLAVDLPFVTSAVVTRLVDRCDGFDATIAIDGYGKRQPLLAAYSAESLRARLAALDDQRGASMNRLIEGMRFTTVLAPGAAQDCDTLADLEIARSRGGI